MVIILDDLLLMKVYFDANSASLVSCCDERAIFSFKQRSPRTAPPIRQCINKK